MTTLTVDASKLSCPQGDATCSEIELNGSVKKAWRLAGANANQSVVTTIDNLPDDCKGVKIEIQLAVKEAFADNAEDVYRVYASQPGGDEEGMAHVRSKVAQQRTVELEAYIPVDASKPLNLRVERISDDAVSTYKGDSYLLNIVLAPVHMDANPVVVQDTPGYNSWPMIGVAGSTLVCTYSRGAAHSIGSGERGVYAKTSTDGGRTWTEETCVVNRPQFGEVTIGSGVNSKGDMLLWVRCYGAQKQHELFKTTDGVHFESISVPTLDPMPMQITDIIAVPTVGLMALWFAGNYQNDDYNAWGTLVSNDDGVTWCQHTIEKAVPKADWPTEPSPVYLGDGKILVIARTEFNGGSAERAQFQLQSSDYGKTWQKLRSNIADVAFSTPSLKYDAASGMLCTYYYQRGRGILKRRTAHVDDVWNKPLNWSVAEPVGLGSRAFFDAGNVNVATNGNKHYMAYYSGEGANTSVLVQSIDAPWTK